MTYTRFPIRKLVPISVLILLAVFSLGYAHLSETIITSPNRSLVKGSGIIELPEAKNTPLLACNITLKPTVSGCYLVGGQSKATVSVEVAWTEAPVGDSIKVTLGGQTRYIKPGPKTVTYPQVPGNPAKTGTQTIISPQVVAFEVNANGSVNNSVTANFIVQNSCNSSTTYSLPAACASNQCQSPNIGGIVFKDFNDNGIREAGETAGVAGVSVKAVACDGTVYTTTTDGYGRYSLPVPVGKYPVRVEFDKVPSIYNLGVQGADSRTSVQFVNAPDCSVDLGVINPVDYCSDNALRVFVPCFTYGDPLVSGTSGNADALVSIPYGVSSNAFLGEKSIALASQVGTIWGLAYNKYTKRLFQSAVLKRHAGLGPLGLGGLYVTDLSNPSTPLTTPFLNVKTDLGVDIGTVASNSDRGLVADRTKPSRDAQAFPLIGKTGIGDLEISEDGNKLWFINMFDKKLYSIDITQFNLNGTKPKAAQVSSVVIPATCAGGEYRPWALKVNDGKVYVGGICDGQTSGKSSLRATVYELNGPTISKIFDFPLTYPKGYPAAANTNLTGWFPWTDTFDDLLEDAAGTILRHPVPMFTDIEFDIDGSMVLAFGDRTGWQGGDQNYRPNGTTTTLYEVNSQAGDILRAFSSNGAFVLENNAKAGPSVGYGPNNSQGPGFGEFYNDNWIQENGTVIYHAEEVMGGLALKPGSGEVVVTTIDPVDKHPFAGGVRYMNNTTGLVTGAYAVYITRGVDGSQNPGTFAKATGLGDVELNCGILNIMEIGNRVWIDQNKDGVQDTCEKSLKDVNVALYKGANLIAATKTDAMGEYYFSSKSKLKNGTWSGIAADTMLLATTDYKIVFGSSGQTSANGDTLKIAGLGKFLLTKQNATANNGNDLNDSDAAKTSIAGGNFATISLQTGKVGEANHTYDAGFYCIEPKVNFTIANIKATCNGLTAKNDGKLQLTASTLPYDKFRLKIGAGAFTGDSTYATATAIGNTFPKDLQAAIPNAGATYKIRFYLGECCYKDTTIVVAAVSCACPPTALAVKATNPSCTEPGNLSLTSTSGDKYGISKGATYTGPAYATATAVGTLPAVIKAGISNAADSAFTIRVFNKTNDCFKDTTVTVKAALVKPNAGTDQILACADPVTNTLTTSTTLTGFAPVGGTFTAQAGNPASATVTNAGGVTGMSVAGTYRFIYTANGCADTVSVVVQPCAVCVKPNAGPDASTICAPLTASKLTAVTPGGSWSPIVSPANPAPASIDASGNVSGLTANGTYRFVYSVTSGGQTCTDTASVIRNAKPVVTDAAICAPATTATLAGFTPAGGTWSVQAGNPAGATVTNAGVVSGLTANGTYKFIYTLNGCADTASVVRNAKPSAGTDQTLACADPVNGTLQTSTTLMGFTPTGGTWSVQSGNPASASVTNAGAVTGMSVAGSYKFIYTLNGCADTVMVTVQSCVGCTKPDAGSDQSICEPMLTTTLAGFSPAGGTWIAQSGNPAGATVTNAGGVSGMSVNGTYNFIYTVLQGGQTCSDTVAVVRKPKPVVGNAEICEPATTTSVTLNLTGGSWVADGTNPAAATITNAGAVSGLTANGTYRFIYTLNGCSDTSIVIRKPKPMAGPDMMGTGAICNTVATVNLPDAAAGESWTQLGTTPKQVTIGATSGVVTGMDAIGVYQFILANSVTGCSDTVQVEVKNCNKGSIGDFVWKDLNDNGIQDTGEPGVKGVIVQLLNGGTNALITSDTTDANGLYGFPNLDSGNYKVKILTSSLPDSCLITAKKDVATGGGNDSNDSDFDPATGESPVIVINVNGTGTSKDNPTIDAGLYSPKGSIGDFVWKDLNDNGQQDGGEPGVNGVKVILWKAAGGVPTTKLDSTLTAGNGAYLFSGLKKGDYIVQIALSTLPDTCLISLKKDVGNDTSDNDFTPAGLSPVVSIDPALGGISKDNPSIDAALYSPCTKPVIGALTPTAATCTGTITNNDASFTVSGISGGNRYAFATTLAGLAPYRSATPLAGSGFSITGLPNPSVLAGQTYFIRVYNGKDDCFLDATVLVPFKDCSNNCVKPNAGADVAVCKPVTTVNLPDAAANEEWVASGTNPSGATINPVTGVVNGLATNGLYSFILRDKTLGSTCSDTVVVLRGVLELPKQSTCFDTLSLPRVAGATYTTAAGNPASITASGLASGMSTPGTVYTFIITRGQCSDTVRVERLKCDKDYDLSLKKSISKKLAMLGDTLTYTIQVKNEGEATAHGVEVTDVLNAGVQYISGVATLGSYSATTKKWSFDSITVGATLTLTIKVRVVAQGVWFNTAEITRMTEKDIDSTPGNGVEGEDDIDHACFTVPVMLCRGQGSSLQLSVPAQYTGVVWFRKVQNGQPVQVGTGNSYQATETELGSYEYTFTSALGNCPAEGCCPIIIAVQDCCPVEVCVPFVITKKKK